MITAQDLRIGNLVRSNLHDGLATEIHSIMPNGVKLWANPLAPCYKFDEVSGIALTEEWLVKFGFDKSTDAITYYHRNKFCGIAVMFDNGFIETRVSGQVVSFISKVHHLQNLYHALTGQELVIK